MVLRHTAFEIIAYPDLASTAQNERQLKAGSYGLTCILSIALALVVFGTSCSSGVTPTSRVSSAPASESVAIRSGDLPKGLDRCALSGSIASYLERYKAAPDVLGAYHEMQAAWERLQTAGATDAYYVVFSNSQMDCAVFAGKNPPTGYQPPSPTLSAINLVVQFKDSAAASSDWNNSDGYIQSSVENEDAANSFTVSTGSQTGLGPLSRVATRNSDYEGGINYVAIWLNKSFEVSLLTFEIDLDLARQAAVAINARIG